MWIEIKFIKCSRERSPVTPFAGVWIEMTGDILIELVQIQVTPFAGVWIEIILPCFTSYVFSSPPSRGCGLKYRFKKHRFAFVIVTPFAGVWIEMCMSVDINRS